MVIAFGDSITAGSGASDTAHRYANLLSTYELFSLDNQGVNSSEFLDEIRDNIYNHSTTQEDVNFALLAYDDMRRIGNNSTDIGHLADTLRSAAVFLCIPRSSIITGALGSVTYSGTWSGTSVWNGNLTKFSGTNGDTATFSLSGTTIYIDSLIFSTQDRALSVTVDGVSKGTVGGGGLNPTNAGTVSAPSLLRITGLSDTSHTVVLTVIGTSGNAFFNFAASSTGWKSTTNPMFVVGGPLKMLAASYLLYTPFNQGSDAASDAINTAFEEVCTTLQGDGLGVVWVNAGNGYNTTTDVAADGVYPNDSGHAKIANNFIAAITSYIMPNNLISSSQGVAIAADNRWSTRGLTHYYPFMEGTGSSAANIAGLQQNVGALLTGSSFISGGGVACSGTASGVDLDNTNGVFNDLIHGSWSMYLKTNLASFSAWAGLLVKTGGLYYDFSIQAHSSDNYFTVRINDNASFYNPEAFVPNSVLGQHNIFLTFNSSTNILLAYIDGIFVESVYIGHTLATSSGILRLLTSWDNISPTGNLYIFAFFDHLLYPQQVAALSTNINQVYQDVGVDLRSFSPVLSATSGITVSDKKIGSSAPVVSSATGLTVSSVAIKKASAVLTSVTGIVIGPRKVGTSSPNISATPGVSVTSLSIKKSSPVLPGSTSAVVSSKKVGMSALALSGTSGLEATDKKIGLSSPVLTVTSGITIVGQVVGGIPSSSPVLTAVSGMVVSGKKVTASSPVLSANTGIAVVGVKIASSSPVLTGSTYIVVDGRMVEVVIQASPVLTAVSGITVYGEKIARGPPVLTAIAGITTDGYKIAKSSPVLTGVTGIVVKRGIDLGIIEEWSGISKITREWSGISKLR